MGRRVAEGLTGARQELPQVPGDEATDDGRETNPYAPPAGNDRIRDEVLGRMRRIAFVLCIGLGGYAVFVGMLLVSVRGDREAGIMMAGHLTLLLAGTVFVVMRRYAVWTVPAAGVLGQIFVTILMLLVGIGDPWRVIVINGGITLGFALVAVCYLLLLMRERSREQQPSGIHTL